MGGMFSEAIRQPRITEITYRAADNPWVREELVKQQRAIGEKCGSLVTEGRDQGTIVFPNAPFKFYLNAHPEERARRRIAQLAAKGISVEQSDVLEQLPCRDMCDQTRAIGKLAPAKDAIDIDTTDLTLEETVEAMLTCVSNPAASGVWHDNPRNSDGDSISHLYFSRRRVGPLSAARVERRAVAVAHSIGPPFPPACLRAGDTSYKTGGLR